MSGSYLLHIFDGQAVVEFPRVKVRRAEVGLAYGPGQDDLVPARFRRRLDLPNELVLAR